MFWYFSKSCDCFDIFVSYSFLLIVYYKGTSELGCLFLTDLSELFPDSIPDDILVIFCMDTCRTGV